VYVMCEQTYTCTHIHSGGRAAAPYHRFHIPPHHSNTLAHGMMITHFFDTQNSSSRTVTGTQSLAQCLCNKKVMSLCRDRANSFLKTEILRERFICEIMAGVEQWLEKHKKGYVHGYDYPVPLRPDI